MSGKFCQRQPFRASSDEVAQEGRQIVGLVLDMGTVIVVAIFTILFNLIVDILYAVVDPRVRYD